MKLSFLTSLLLVLILSQGCEFEISTGFEKKIPIPHSNTDSKGIGADPAIMTLNDQSITSNIFTFGTTVKFTFNNITGLNRIKGLVYPGMRMRIKNSDGKTLYEVDDLLEEANNGTDANPLFLSANFTADLHNMSGEKYSIELKIWDKKGSGTLTFSLPFEVKASDVLSIEKNELNCSNIYFWDETDQKVVLDNHIDVNHEFILIHEGLEGFDLIDGFAYPGISVLLVDNNGKELLSNDNVVGNVRETGIGSGELKATQAPVKITLASGIAANPCHLKVKIYDFKNAEKHMTIEADLVLE